MATKTKTLYDQIVEATGLEFDADTQTVEEYKNAVVGHINDKSNENEEYYNDLPDDVVDWYQDAATTAKKNRGAKNKEDLPDVEGLVGPEDEDGDEGDESGDADGDEGEGGEEAEAETETATRPPRQRGAAAATSAQRKKTGTGGEKKKAAATGGEKKKKTPPAKKTPVERDVTTNRYGRAAEELFDEPKSTAADIAKACDMSETAAAYCIAAFKAVVAVARKRGLMK